MRDKSQWVAVVGRHYQWLLLPQQPNIHSAIAILAALEILHQHWRNTLLGNRRILFAAQHTRTGGGRGRATTNCNDPFARSTQLAACARINIAKTHQQYHPHCHCHGYVKIVLKIRIHFDPQTAEKIALPFCATLDVANCISYSFWTKGMMRYPNVRYISQRVCVLVRKYRERCWFWARAECQANVNNALQVWYKCILYWDQHSYWGASDQHSISILIQLWLKIA